jgi:hypothetical protein
MASLTELLGWALLLIALCGPVAAVGNSHLGRAALVAFGPAALISLGALVSLEAAWGHRPSGDSGFSNTAKPRDRRDRARHRRDLRLRRRSELLGLGAPTRRTPTQRRAIHSHRY